MAEVRFGYCSQCGRRVAATKDGVARRHKPGPRNRGYDYVCSGSGRPLTANPARDAAKALKSRAGSGFARNFVETPAEEWKAYLAKAR